MAHDPINDLNLPNTETGIEQHLERLEDQLYLLNRQVEQLQRFAALGTVATMLAHELNNLLTPILGHGQYALERGEPDLMRRAVEKTCQSAGRMQTLCRRVLGMAVDAETGPRETLIAPLVADAVECMGRPLERDQIELSIEVPADLKAVAHPGHLQQVLFNLILNARQAMLDRPGKLAISARETTDQRVTIDIEDNGPGIRPEHVDRIFEPFFSTRLPRDHSEDGGSGLGLHICKRLIEQDGGTISVSTRLGAGTRFTVTLATIRRE